jgi:sortase A
MNRFVTATIAKVAIVAGVLVLVTTGGYLLWTRQAGTQRAAHTVEALQQQWSAPQAPDHAATTPKNPEPPIPGLAFAIMTIPRFGSSWQMPVFEGTSSSVLRGGVGHYTNTALPGAIGNFAVAGHRTTWAHPFREVERLQIGDRVIVRTEETRFTYRVTGHQVVHPDETAVLDPVPGAPDAMPDQAQLTLTTCHPEYSAWRRWVVRAVLVQATPI